MNSRRNGRLALDLNLLVAFDALMEHGGVSAAAKAVGRSQPAMSNALARLRASFRDELLVRTGVGMTPTPAALKAHGAVKAALAGIAEALAEVQDFAPARDARRFRVAMAEDAAFYLLPELVRDLAQSAPGIEVQVLSTAHLPGVELVAAGAAEAAVGLVPKNLSKDIRFEPVFTERLVAVARRGHPAFRGQGDKSRPALTMRDFLAWPHVAVQPSSATPSRVDVALAALGRTRRVAATVPHVLLAPHLLPGTELIACLPERVVRVFAAPLGLAVKEAPVALGPYQASLAWHRRFDQDRGHQWLRGEIRARCRKLAES